MTSRRLDRLARALAAHSPRRGLVAAALAALAADLPDAARVAAGCTKPGKRCDRSRECCGDARCKRGRCRCASGLSACGRACRDLSRDPLNCGWCGRNCGAGNPCIDGVCVP